MLNDHFHKFFSQGQTYLELGIKAALGFPIFSYAGFTVDNCINTSPLFTILGIILGIISFCAILYIFIKKTLNDSSSKFKK